MQAMFFQTVTDWIALVLLALLSVFSISDRAYSTELTRGYRTCLSIASAAVASQLLLHVLSFAFALPYWVSALLFSLNMLLASSMLAAGSVYVINETIDARLHKRPIFIAKLLLLGTLVLFALIVLINPFSGLLFGKGEGESLVIRSAPWFAVGLHLLDTAVLLAFTLRFSDRRSLSHLNSVFLYAFLLFSFTGLHLFSSRMQLTSISQALLVLVLYVSFQRQRVHRDRLTNCGSREALFSRMDRMIDRHQPFTMVQVSLRRFRRINRRFGLSSGDQLLRQVARSLGDICPGDSVFRFNGTDFVILHPHSPDAQLDAETKKLRERFQRDWGFGDATARLNASFAQISYPSAGSTREELINNLEYCQLKSRTLESKGVVVFNDAIRQEMFRRDRLFETISDGIANDRFFLVYQPIYDPYHDRPCAAEALLRLRDEDGRIISPGVFIPAAEENGSIIVLTWVVLEKVCRFLRDHRAMRLPAISINFSVQQFLDSDMCDNIAAMLERYGVDPLQIKIEITERVFSEDNEILSANVRRLKEMGIGLYLDDFGTGYSNLSSVIRLPFEVVKVDKTLLSAQQSARPDILLHAVVSGLKHIGAQVAIEGVETDEQSRRAQEMGVDRIQGFFYARPMAEDAFVEHMGQHQPEDRFVFPHTA